MMMAKTVKAVISPYITANSVKSLYAVIAINLSAILSANAIL
uniref:Uncharacterized protein n=1 Tax=Anguilla anguilla TaxID=7936 RepID=A0A0E9QEZ5_ANGAN